MAKVVFIIYLGEGGERGGLISWPSSIINAWKGKLGATVTTAFFHRMIDNEVSLVKNVPKLTMCLMGRLLPLKI